MDIKDFNLKELLIKDLKALPLEEQLEELQGCCPFYGKCFYGHDSNEYYFNCSYENESSCHPQEECLTRF
jgi:hypothetical protein